ncbi:unnamed protein product [Urochloa humidicola]
MVTSYAHSFLPPFIIQLPSHLSQIERTKTVGPRRRRCRPRHRTAPPPSSTPGSAAEATGGLDTGRHRRRPPHRVAPPKPPAALTPARACAAAKRLAASPSPNRLPAFPSPSRLPSSPSPNRLAIPMRRRNPPPSDRCCDCWRRVALVDSARRRCHFRRQKNKVPESW